MTRRARAQQPPWPDGGEELAPLPDVAGGESPAEQPPSKARLRLLLWDRIKLVLLLSAAWVVLVWVAMANNPILSFPDAVRQQLRSQWWLLVLVGVEVVRQAHFLVSERSVAYHQHWVRRFAGLERRTGSLNDWTRFRMARVFRWLVIIAVISLLLGKATHVSPVLALFQIPARVVKALPFLAQVLVILFVVVGQFAAMFWFLSRGGVEVIMPDDIPTRFTDVWGQDAVLDRVKENMVFLENPQSVEERGGYVPGGILLWGPPGTGKTLMAEAVAGETGKPYVFVEPSAFINMFMGIGPLKVKSLFRKLRKLALRFGGVVVFFDEADSLGSRGAIATGGSGGWGSVPAGGGAVAAGAAADGDPAAPGPWATAGSCNGLQYVSEAMTGALYRHALRPAHAHPAERPGLVSRFVMGGMGMNGGGMGTLQVLLTELSGLKKARGLTNRLRRMIGMRPKPPPKYRILVMMATNMPQALDEALLRPGRIDRVYKVGYPSKEGRKRTYEGYLAKVRHQLTPEQVDKLATITPYATGASIKDMVNEALILSLRDERDGIEWRDIVKAKQLKEHGLPDDTEYIERERHSVAIHEACHAVAAYRVRRHAIVDIATIERRGDIGGFVASIPPEDRFVNWRSEHEADIVVSLASLAGERIFFEGDNSAGVGGDLRSATTVAMLMEAYWGMGDGIASHAVTLGSLKRLEALETGADRQVFETEFGHRVEGRLAEIYDRTWRLLEANRLEVLAVAHALETHKTISGDDVAAVIEGWTGPLVDGRPYHLTEFREFIERYHASVAAAHARNVPIDVAMPVWLSEPTGALAAVSASTAAPAAPGYSGPPYSPGAGAHTGASPTGGGPPPAGYQLWQAPDPASRVVPEPPSAADRFSPDTDETTGQRLGTEAAPRPRRAKSTATKSTATKSTATKRAPGATGAAKDRSTTTATAKRGRAAPRSQET